MGKITDGFWFLAKRVKVRLSWIQFLAGKIGQNAAFLGQPDALKKFFEFFSDQVKWT